MTRIFAACCLLLLFVVIALSGCAEQTASPVPTPVLNDVIEPTAIPQPSPTATRTRTPAPTSTSTPAPTATPFITSPASGEKVNIPILMYHHLKYEPPGTSVSIKTWTVSPDQFAAQLDMLQ